MQRDNMFAASIQDSDFGKKFQDFPKCVAILLRNPTFVFLTMAEFFDGIILTGLGAFLPKIMEILFLLDPYFAAEVVGYAILVTGALGTLAGGVIITKLKLDIKGIIKVCIVTSLLCFASSFMFLYSCENEGVAGINTPYNGEVTFGNLEAACNLNCGCSSLEFNPVCGSDGLTYYSSCYAGCQGTDVNGTHLDCGCIGDAIKTATYGACNKVQCPYGGEAFYLALMAIAICAASFYTAPTAQATLRSVPFSQRSFALGVQALIYRIGYIIGPIVYGTLLDNTCMFRPSTGCEGEYGYCSVFNNTDVTVSMATVTLVLQALATIGYILALLLYKPIHEDETTKPSEKEGSGQVNPSYSNEASL